MQAEHRHEQVWQWFEAHAAYLYTWLRVRLGPGLSRRLDAEDLLQDVWVRVVGRTEEKRIEHPRAWLLGVASHVLIEAIKTQTRRGRVVAQAADSSVLRDMPERVTTLTRRIARDEARRAFFVALDELESGDRQLFVEHGLEDRPLTQVAAKLGISTDAAHKRWQRLRDRLRKLGSPADLLG